MRYVLNIVSKRIHKENCGLLLKAKPCNLKYFNCYEDAANFFESNTERGIPCGVCLKNKHE